MYIRTYFNSTECTYVHTSTLLNVHVYVHMYFNSTVHMYILQLYCMYVRACFHTLVCTYIPRTYLRMSCASGCIHTYYTSTLSSLFCLHCGSEYCPHAMHSTNPCHTYVHAYAHSALIRVRTYIISPLEGSISWVSFLKGMYPISATC